MGKDIKIYHVETQEDYDDLMIKLENEGCMWASGDKPTSENYWYIREKETVIYLGSWGKREMTRGDLSEAKSQYPTIPIVKHKAKGVEQMEKVVVPQFVADYIENYYNGSKPNELDKAALIRYSDSRIKFHGDTPLKDWFKNESNFFSFIMAVATNNYEVEEEKKYYWRKKKEYMFSFADGIHQFLNIDSNGVCSFGSNAEIAGYRTNLTETQVRQAVREEDFNKLERVEIDDV